MLLFLCLFCNAEAESLQSRLPTTAARSLTDLLMPESFLFCRAALTKFCALCSRLSALIHACIRTRALTRFLLLALARVQRLPTFLTRSHAASERHLIAFLKLRSVRKLSHSCSTAVLVCNCGCVCLLVTVFDFFVSELELLLAALIALRLQHSVTVCVCVSVCRCVCLCLCMLWMIMPPCQHPQHFCSVLFCCVPPFFCQSFATFVIFFVSLAHTHIFNCKLPFSLPLSLTLDISIVDALLLVAVVVLNLT